MIAHIWGSGVLPRSHDSPKSLKGEGMLYGFEINKGDISWPKIRCRVLPGCALDVCRKEMSNSGRLCQYKNGRMQAVCQSLKEKGFMNQVKGGAQKSLRLFIIPCGRAGKRALK